MKFKSFLSKFLLVIMLTFGSAALLIGCVDDDEIEPTGTFDDSPPDQDQNDSD